jgi:hypothetical protein
MSWVVRGGLASVKALRAVHKEHRGVPGLYRFSVQYAPGLTAEELARVGVFPHTQISFAPDHVLAATLTPLGYQTRLVKSPGQGYHHTFAVLYDANEVMLPSLLPDAAQALRRAFRHRPNPLLQPQYWE